MQRGHAVRDFEYAQGDLLEPLPFEHSSFTSVSAFDVLEHIPRTSASNSEVSTNGFIRLMSEVHRVLRPCGVFLAVTPAVPSPAAFQDPTHVNFITKRTVDYFIGPDPVASRLGYGFTGDFNLTHQGWLRREMPEQARNTNADVVGPQVDAPHQPLSARLSSTSIKKLPRLLQRRLTLVVRPSHLVWLLEKAER